MGTLHVKHYWQKRVVNFLFSERWYNRIKLAKIILDYKLGKRYEASPLFKYLFNKNSTILDIGANMGQYACRLSDNINNGGRIYCFEPVNANFTALKGMKQLLKLNNVSIYNKGISNVVGEAVINIPVLKGDLVETTLASLSKEDEVKYRTESIKVTTIDTFVSENAIENVDFIKCDTERNGNNVLKGGWQTIKNFLPILSLELFYNLEMERKNENLKWLLEAGYQPYYYDSTKNRLRRVNDKQRGNLILLTEERINCLTAYSHDVIYSHPTEKRSFTKLGKVSKD